MIGHVGCCSCRDWSFGIYRLGTTPGPWHRCEDFSTCYERGYSQSSSANSLQYMSLFAKSDFYSWPAVHTNICECVCTSALAREPSPRLWDGQSYFKTSASILEDGWINDTRRVIKWYKYRCCNYSFWPRYMLLNFEQISIYKWISVNKLTALADQNSFPLPSWTEGK